VVHKQFEEHLRDELRPAHAGHCTEFLGRCPGLGGHGEKPVYARLCTAHMSFLAHIAGQRHEAWESLDDDP
jgi:hypothetical protein